MTETPTTEPPTSPITAQSFFSSPRRSRAERAAQGESVRDAVPLATHADVPVPDARRDPVALLAEQDANREQALVPLRY